MKEMTPEQFQQKMNKLEEYVEKGILHKEVCPVGVIVSEIDYQYKDGNIGYLYIPIGGSVMTHGHDKGIWEEYRIVYGEAIVNAKHLQQGEKSICPVGDTHYAVNCSMTQPLLIFYRRRKEAT